MQTLHGYTLDESQWKAKGGGGQCNIAKKDGKEYFIKRLAFPRYPDSDNFRGDFRQKKIDICNAWFKNRQDIIRAIPGSGTGTTVKPIEYFRVGSCYYEVANMIDITSIPYDQIYKESIEDKARIMLTVAMSLSDLHKNGVVHGDLDPGNILISRLAGSNNLVTKLIDFTDSFFENNPPETIMSKDFWWSPEVALYSKAAASGITPNPYKKYITCKADVFSLGIVFHQYCSKDGEPPICTKSQPWQEFNAGKKPQIDEAIEPCFRNLISSMLECEPSDRPTMLEVHKTLLQILKGGTLPQSLSVEGEKKLSIISPSYCEDKTNNEIRNFGSDALKAGIGVRSARRHERNPQKVVLVFNNGKEQIMDLALAKRQGYVTE